MKMRTAGESVFCVTTISYKQILPKTDEIVCDGDADLFADGAHLRGHARARRAHAAAVSFGGRIDLVPEDGKVVCGGSDGQNHHSPDCDSSNPFNGKR